MAVHLDFDTAGFTVVDHRDIPGRNVVALIQDDQPPEPPAPADPVSAAKGKPTVRDYRSLSNATPHQEFKGLRTSVPFECRTSPLKVADGRIRVPTSRPGRA